MTRARSRTRMITPKLTSPSLDMNRMNKSDWGNYEPEQEMNWTDWMDIELVVYA